MSPFSSYVNLDKEFQHLIRQQVNTGTPFAKYKNGKETKKITCNEVDYLVEVGLAVIKQVGSQLQIKVSLVGGNIDFTGAKVLLNLAGTQHIVVMKVDPQEISNFGYRYVGFLDLNDVERSIKLPDALTVQLL